MTTFSVAPSARQLASGCSAILRSHHWRAVRAGAASGSLPPAAGSGGSGSSVAPAASGGMPGFLQNPVIAQRELMRQFFQASSAEEQLRLVGEAGARLDLHTGLQLLCHLADLSQRGLLPGSAEQQAELVGAIHCCLAPSLPGAAPLHLATALWSYAAVGTRAGWLDELLLQAAERELAAGPRRLEAYNTKELTSLLFAYGQLARQRPPVVLQYSTALAAELLRRWDALPYVKGSFSSTDFADLACACARLYSSPAGAAAGSVAPDSASSGQPGSGGGDGSGGRTVSAADGSSSSSSRSSSSSTAAAAAALPPPPLQQLPPEVAALLDGLASEVRRQLANKSSISPWTPRDLVRLARAYAALGHASRRVRQLLDVLASFCVQRMRTRHLNCLSRPADLVGLLEAYADLRHASVAVPELLAAVDDQVRRSAAAQQEQAAAATEAAAPAALAGTAVLQGSATAQQQAQQQQLGPAGAAGAAVAGAPAPVAAAPPVAGTPLSDGFTLAHISSLVESHLRLGYEPPPLLLQCLGPQIVRQLPGCPAEDASALLQVLAAANCSPGAKVVQLLLGRAIDGAQGGTGSGSSSGSGDCSSEGSSAAPSAAQRAANVLLAGRAVGGSA